MGVKGVGWGLRGWGEGGKPPNFFGGEFFFISAFFGNKPPGTRHRNTVNVWPVRILLECILVLT